MDNKYSEHTLLIFVNPFAVNDNWHQLAFELI